MIPVVVWAIQAHVDILCDVCTVMKPPNNFFLKCILNFKQHMTVLYSYAKPKLRPLALWGKPHLQGQGPWVVNSCLWEHKQDGDSLLATPEVMREIGPGWSCSSWAVGRIESSINGATGETGKLCLITRETCSPQGKPFHAIRQNCPAYMQ